jgi:hypothetical protein
VWKKQQQIPLGNDNKGHSWTADDIKLVDVLSRLWQLSTRWALSQLRLCAKGEIRGSLHCAVHDKTVNRFGRDDGFWVGDTVVEDDEIVDADLRGWRLARL